jgi:hypothetical protein
MRHGLPARQGKPVQRRIRDIDVGIAMAGPECVTREPVRRRAGGDGGAPQPTAEQHMLRHLIEAGVVREATGRAAWRAFTTA